MLNKELVMRSKCSEYLLVFVIIGVIESLCVHKIHLQNYNLNSYKFEVKLY